MAKRGRPKGSKNKKTLKYTCTESPVIPVDLSNVKTYKFIGYCVCGFFLSTNHLKKNCKTKYICPSCDKTGKVKNLIKDKVIPEEEIPKSKKEYIDRTINAEFHDVVPLNNENDMIFKEDI